MRDPAMSPTDHVLKRVKVGSPSDKAVLVAMARAGNWWGEESELAVDTIAEQTELSRRTVQECRRRLEANGFIEKTGRSRRYKTDVYRILGVQESDGSEGEGRSRASAEGAAAAPEVEEQHLETATEASPPLSPRLTVWAHYLTVQAKRGDPERIPKDERAIIDEALAAVGGDVERLLRAIDGNKASSFHQGANDRRKKYNALSQILRGRKATGRYPARTTLETIEMFEALASATAGRSSSATPAEISHHKRAVLDGIATPGDEHVARRGEESAAWLKETVGLEWSVEAREWKPVE